MTNRGKCFKKFIGDIFRVFYCICCTFNLFFGYSSAGQPARVIGSTELAAGKTGELGLSTSVFMLENLQPGDSLSLSTRSASGRSHIRSVSIAVQRHTPYIKNKCYIKGSVK